MEAFASLYKILIAFRLNLEFEFAGIKHMILE